MVCKGQPFLNWLYSNTISIKDDPYWTSCRGKRFGHHEVVKSSNTIVPHICIGISESQKIYISRKLPCVFPRQPYLYRPVSPPLLHDSIICKTNEYSVQTTAISKQPSTANVFQKLTNNS
jgi:hypothetical protein